MRNTVILLFALLTLVLSATPGANAQEGTALVGGRLIDGPGAIAGLMADVG